MGKRGGLCRGGYFSERRFSHVKIKGRQGSVYSGSVLLAGFASCFFHEIRVPSVESMEGERALIQGRILQSEIKETSGGDEYLQLKMSAEAVNGDREAAGGRILVRYYGDLKGRPEEQVAFPGS